MNHWIIESKFEWELVVNDRFVLVVNHWFELVPNDWLDRDWNIWVMIGINISKERIEIKN